MTTLEPVPVTSPSQLLLALRIYGSPDHIRIRRRYNRSLVDWTRQDGSITASG